MTGPGTVPPNVHPWYITPFAISMVASLIGIRNAFTPAADAGARRASNAGVVARTTLPKSTTSTRELARLLPQRAAVSAVKLTPRLSASKAVVVYDRAVISISGIVDCFAIYRKVRMGAERLRRGRVEIASG